MFVSKYVSFSSLGPNTSPCIGFAGRTGCLGGNPPGREPSLFTFAERAASSSSGGGVHKKKIALPYGFPSLKGLSLRGCCVQGIGLAQYVCDGEAGTVVCCYYFVGCIVAIGREIMGCYLFFKASSVLKTMWESNALFPS